ncbi:MAG: hypothetical protein JRF63_16210 [Deltaproteobacteria bacterium]|nr:hypothetical protein [Deltaproteobacteria bacterium]
MKPTITRAIPSALLAALLALPSSAGAEAENLPPAEELVAKVLAWAKEQHEKKRQYAFKRLADVELLDSDGKADEREQRVYRAVQIDGHTYDRLVSVDGEPLDEERRVLGREQVRGRDAFVMTFEPNTSVDLPEEEDEDRFLNAFAGKVWIDAEDFAIARIHARLIHTVRFGLGLLAYFKKISLKLDQRRNANGVWLPHTTRTYVWGRSLLLKPIRLREQSRFVDYRQVK